MPRLQLYWFLQKKELDARIGEDQSKAITNRITLLYK